MAVTEQYSDQLTLTRNKPGEFIDTSEQSGKKRTAYVSFTQSGAGDAGSKAVLCSLPAGRLRIILDECRMANSAFGTSRTLAFGTQAYTNKDGSENAADDDALKAAYSVASAATQQLSAAAGADPTLYINSRTGVTIEATVAGGTIPDGATIYGVISYIKE